MLIRSGSLRDASLTGSWDTGQAAERLTLAFHYLDPFGSKVFKKITAGMTSYNSLMILYKNKKTPVKSGV